MLKFLSFLLISTSYASAFVIQHQAKKTTINLSKKWYYLQDSFGVPHLFITKNEIAKSSISLTFTGLKEVKLSELGLSKTQGKYRQKRREWAKKRGVKLQSFHDYKPFKNKNKLQVHSVGMVYSLGKRIFDEFSYYIECPKEFIHIKSVIIHSEDDVKREARSVIDSFACPN
jgi:hypothetical protein